MKVVHKYSKGGKALAQALKAYAQGGKTDPKKKTYYDASGKEVSGEGQYEYYKEGTRYFDPNGNQVTPLTSPGVTRADRQTAEDMQTLGGLAGLEWQSHPNYNKIWASALYDFSTTEGMPPDHKTNPKGYEEWHRRFGNMVERQMATWYDNNPNPDSPEIQKYLAQHDAVLSSGVTNNDNALRDMESFLLKKYKGQKYNFDLSINPYYDMEYPGSAATTFYRRPQFSDTSPGNESNQMNGGPTLADYLKIYR